MDQGAAQRGDNGQQRGQNSRTTEQPRSNQPPPAQARQAETVPATVPATVPVTVPATVVRAPETHSASATRLYVGVLLMAIGLLACIVVVAIAVSPSQYSRAIGTVDTVHDDARVTVRYVVDGVAYRGGFVTTTPVAIGEAYPVAYLVERPDESSNVHIRRSTLMAYVIPAGVFVTLLGLGLAHTS